MYLHYFGNQLLALLGMLIIVESQSCDNSLCNNEGVCVIDKGTTTCKCIGNRHFKGAHCEELVDNCQPRNPCSNKVKCTSVLGAYICSPCPKDYGGMRCSFRQPNSFTKYYLHYRTLADYGKPHKFLITMETLGTEPFLLELYSINYQVEGFSTFSSDPLDKFKWIKSNDLQGVVRHLGMQYSEHLPYNIGYYYAFTGTFWDIGETELTMVIVDLKSSSVVIEFKYALQVILPPQLNCVLQMHIPRCSNPRLMLNIDISRFNTFEPEVKQRCGNSLIQFHWRIYTTLGRMVLHDFGASNKRLLKTAPYLFWFNVHAEALQVYSVQVEAHEMLGRQKNLIGTVARCYVFVITKPVRAIIKGGSYREINSAKSFELDGSSSRDYALSSKVEQDMDFLWNCKSNDDQTNQFCGAKLSKDSKLTVSADVLKAGKSYSFTLNVRSRVNVYSSHNFVQVIKVVTSRWPLYIDIECVRNCQQVKFNSNQLLHMKAACFDCDAEETIGYQWFIGDTNVGKTRRLIYTPTASNTLDLKLKVQNGIREGTAKIKLFKNVFPKGGSCKIDPKSGIEYETEFNINCVDFDDPDHDIPLMYEYIIKNWTLDRTTESEVRLRLPQTNTIKILICDTLNACIENNVNVNVQNMNYKESVTNLEKLLTVPENNLKSLIQYSTSSQFMLLIYVLLQSTKSIETAWYIYQQIEQLQIFTLLEVEQMIHIIENVLMQLQPDDRNIVLFYKKLILILNQGLKSIILDKEVSEFSMKNYDAFTNNFVNIFSKFTMVLEKIEHSQSDSVTNTPRHPSDLLAEKYIPFEEFDITVLQKIEARLEASLQLDKCLQLLGVVESYMHQPGEKPLEITVEQQLKLKAYSIESSDNHSISPNKEIVDISIGSKLVTELQKELKAQHLALQVMIMDKNPFWWYPKDTPLSTNVFYFGIFSTFLNNHFKTTLPHPINFNIQISQLNDTQPSPIVHDELKSNLDMPIYSINLPPNSMLIITIKSSSASLRIGLELKVKPRGYKVRSSERIVPTGKTANFTLLNYKKCSFSTAYVAILADMLEQGKAAFEFTSEIRECISFNYALTDPQWSSQGNCKPTENAQSVTKIQCTCYHMSAFAGNALVVQADSVRWNRNLLAYVPINWYMIAFYLLLLSIVFVILFISRANPGCEELTIELGKEDTQTNCDLIMSIITGRQCDTSTTSNVFLEFLTTKEERFRRFIIQQNPKKPILMANSICTVRLPISSSELVMPLRFDIWLDSKGRYSSWYCRRISIHDLKLKRTYHYIIEQWIHEHNIQTNTVKKSKQNKWLQQRLSDFKFELDSLFSQWFLFQSFRNVMCGMLFNRSTINRYERTCVWLIKLFLCISIVACYFRCTTLETYEEERDNFKNMSNTLSSVIMLSIICYICSLLIYYGMLLLLLYSKRLRK